MGKFFRRLRSRIGIVTNGIVMLVIGAVFYAILAAKPQWASDGTIRIPVKIFVFDAVNRCPIEKAECLVFRGSPISDASSFTTNHSAFDNLPLNEWPQVSRGTTDATGSTMIEHEFHTSANHEHPNPHAHLKNVWVRVEVDGFGGVVLPVGYDERRTSEMRKAGNVVVSIGLLPTK